MEGRQGRQTFSQRLLEGVGAELVSEFENFDRLAAGREAMVESLPKAILEDRGL
jgi:hypothetical protein